jgi:leucyl aminopeptidase (aminopeptidase T)
VLKVREGKVCESSGHPCAKELEEFFLRNRKQARVIADFGVGTLDGAKITGNALEDTKVKGTVHIALGDSAPLGSNVGGVPRRLDGVILRPSVWLDTNLWMDKGIMP